MSALNRRHFERRESASLRTTDDAATTTTGLDVGAATEFPESDERPRTSVPAAARCDDQAGEHPRHPALCVQRAQPGAIVAARARPAGE